METKIARFIFVCICILAVASCSKDDDLKFVSNGAKLGAYESRIEVPKLKSRGTLFIQHSTKANNDSVMTYCMEYDTVKNHSRWVAFRFDGKTRAKGSGRSDDAWADDPKLPAKYKIGAGFFQGYQRGHLCASYDRQYSTEANRQTFYMSNMSPMQGNFNTNYWTTFEFYVQEKGRSTSFADTLYVVKGGTIENGMTQGTTLSGGSKSIVVPKYYFIALLRYFAGSYSAIGFWVEHKDYGYTKSSAPTSVLKEKAVNIDELEEKTGIDFFHNLPDNIEKSIESEDIETLKSVWGLK
jgi:endonuclease G, mitochondrial